jgi:hypothetical protein
MHHTVTYTVLILYSYCTHTVPLLYSYCTHTPGIVLEDPVPIDTNLAVTILEDGSLVGMTRTWSTSTGGDPEGSTIHLVWANDITAAASLCLLCLVAVLSSPPNTPPPPRYRLPPRTGVILRPTSSPQTRSSPPASSRRSDWKIRLFTLTPTDDATRSSTR